MMTHLDRFLAAEWLNLTFLFLGLAAWIAQRRTVAPVWKSRAGRVRKASVLLLLLAVFAVGCDKIDGYPTGCTSAVNSLADLAVAIQKAHSQALLLHARRPSADFTSPGVSQSLLSTPFLQFTGNLTLMVPPLDTSGNFYGVGLQRQSDCSLTEYFLAHYSPTANTFSPQATVPGYQANLRALAQLPASAGTFPNGCKDSPLGISSSGGVVLGLTTDGSQYILAGINPINNTLLTGTLNLTAGTLVQNTVSSVPYPASVAAADLNGDGKPDLVVAGVSNTTTLAGVVYVFLSNGDGTFQAPVTYATGGLNSTAVTIDDVNGDGKLDLVVTGYISGQTTGGVQTLLGNGDGTFKTAVSSPAVGGYYLATGDFNGDGKKDLVLSNGSVLLGKGDGTFAAPAFTLPIAAASNAVAGSVAVGDFNNDGNLDIAVNAPSEPGIGIFLGKGDGTFTAGKTYANIADSSDLTVTDLDGDGNLDLISGLGSSGQYGPSVNTHTGAINVLMGNGDGTFQGAPAFPNTAAPGTVNGLSAAPAFAVGDFNGDGKPDILAANVSTSGGVTTASGFLLLAGDGKGNFSPGVPIGSSSPIVIAVADMNGDGNLDAVIADGSPANGANNVGVALGNGKGSFGAVTDYPLPNSAFVSDIVIGDFNGDGKPDVLVASNNSLTSGLNAIYLLLNNGDGTLASPVVIDTSVGGPIGLAAGDLNGDGKLDFAITTAANPASSTAGALLLYLNKGAGSFDAPASYSPGFNPGGLAIGDMNKDGKLDVVVGWTDQNYANGNLSVYLGKGDGTLQSPQTLQLAGAGAGSSVAIADVDGDGNPDVVWGQAIPVVAFGNGSGGLQGPWGIGLGSAAASIVPVDLNGDTKPDIVSVSNNSIDVFLNLIGIAITPPAAPTADFTLSAGASSLSIAAPGQAGTVTLSVSPKNGFNQSVSFACSGLPSESTCSFSPATVTPSGSAASTTTMTIATTAATSSSLVWPFAGGGFTAAFTLFFFRRKKFNLGVACLLVVAGIACLAAGCGGSSGKSSGGGGTANPGTPAGASIVTVTATSGTGANAVVHSTTVSLTVQ